MLFGSTPEKFVVKTVYFVEAPNIPAVYRKIEFVDVSGDGKVAYNQHEIEEGDEDFIRFLDIEEVTPPTFPINP